MNVEVGAKLFNEKGDLITVTSISFDEYNQEMVTLFNEANNHQAAYNIESVQQMIKYELLTFKGN